MFEDAFQQILENKARRELGRCARGNDAAGEDTHILDLGSCALTDVPEEISELVWLESLSFSGTQVSDLSPLSGLVNLQWIDVSGTQVSDLTPLAGLINLHELDLSETTVSDLSPLVGLTKLRWLNISETLVSDLYPLLPLIEKGLPVGWGPAYWDLDGINVSNCSLTNPPAEVVKQGKEAILNYFCEKEKQGVDHLYEAKMLIIGEGGAGKTSLLRRLYQPDKPLPTEPESTKGIDIYRHEFSLPNGRFFRLNVWDFGGQEIYHATHQFFLTKRSLYILLDDTRKDNKTVHDEAFKYWLEIVDLLGNHSPVLIYQNEKGGRSKTIDLPGIKGRFDNVKECYRGNLGNAGAAAELEKAVEFFVQSLPHIGEELPAKWVAIRADIEDRARLEPYISQNDYFSIYMRHLEFDRVKALHLSQYLHDMGVFLHFHDMDKGEDDELLARTVILQNQWATEAVYKMLDDEVVKDNLGRFTRNDCERVWQDSVYANMHPELRALMRKFELCYQLPDSYPETWLAPQLLPPSKPPKLTDWEQVGDLVLRYRYEFLPKGMISRLMVRLHRFVPRPEMGWTTGVLFEEGDTAVLVEVPPKGGEIVLRARGPERKELLSVIAADLDALNKTFCGLQKKIGKWVPCNCESCSSLAEPEFFEQIRLIKRKRDRKLTVECPSSYQDVNVLELLDGIRADELPGWAKEENAPHILAQEPVKAERTIRIFLASSRELREDRDEFDLYFRQQNDKIRKRGVYLEIIRWETFLDAISETRLQDEYNKAIRNCDIFISLFFTKIGEFTAEEFETAHRQFKETKKPLIYTFFKNAPVNMSNIGEEVVTLLKFKDKLSDLGHFHTDYDNTEHLKRQFKDQLDKLLVRDMEEPTVKRDV